MSKCLQAISKGLVLFSLLLFALVLSISAALLAALHPPFVFAGGLIIFLCPAPRQDHVGYRGGHVIARTIKDIRIGLIGARCRVYCDIVTPSEVVA